MPTLLMEKSTSMTPSEIRKRIYNYYCFLYYSVTLHSCCSRSNQLLLIIYIAEHKWSGLARSAGIYQLHIC